MNKNTDFLKLKGKVIKILRNNTFQIEFENKKVIIANISSEFKNKKNRRAFRLTEGDFVIVRVSLNDLSKGNVISYA